MIETVVTMVDGEVDPDQIPTLLEAFPGESSDDLPDFILGTMLVSEVGSNRWRVVTLWRSMADLEAYLQSVDTPAAKQAFLAAGAEPSVSVWNADRVLLSH